MHRAHHFWQQNAVQSGKEAPTLFYLGLMHQVGIGLVFTGIVIIIDTGYQEAQVVRKLFSVKYTIENCFIKVFANLLVLYFYH